MKHHSFLVIPMVMLASLLWAQRTGDVPSSIQRVRDLNDQARQLDSVDRITGKRQFSSDGQWQMNDIVKAQYAQLTSDTEKLNKLTNELRAELANPSVLSVGSMRKAEEIEKLAKKVRSRLKGWF
jgi:parvulin-like peptidyl-prolyl isomerase